ncbi:MAG: AMP-binding protein [bacterium]|nr:AMP-binding protein [bacterium]
MPQRDPPDRQSVGRILHHRATEAPDAPFVLSDRRTLTYGEAHRDSNRLANGITELGIESGEAVLVVMPNVVEFILVWLGLGKTGAVQVPVNTALRGNLLTHIINDSSARTMIVATGFLDCLGEVAGDLEHLERLVVFNPAGAQPPLPHVLSHLDRIDFPQLLEAHDAPPGDLPRHHDLKAVMYTSGTTGPSKGVMISQRQAYGYAHGNFELMDLKPGDIYYAPLPLFHIAGQWAMCYSSMIAGSAAVVTERFSVERFWSDARRFGATVTFFLGAMANFLARQPRKPDDGDVPIERALVVPMFPDAGSFASRFDMKIKTTYGSTEVSAPHRMDWNDPDWKTCGRLADEFYEARIVDANDEEVPDGTVGEFVIRGKEPWLLMSGYWRHPDWTERAWSNLWLHSGDAMMKTSDGRYYFVDRMSDSIRRRGENISSLEVENEINLHADVLECAVFPVPSEHTEDEVMATVIPQPGCTLDPETLVRFLEPRMARFMVPRYIDVATSLPKTPTGKIRKVALRHAGVTSSTFDREKAGVTLKR